MEDDLRVGREVGQDLCGLLVGRSRMDDERLAQLRGQLRLASKGLQLAVARRVVAEVIESRLPHRHGLRMLEQARELFQVFVAGLARLVRMQA